MLLPAPLAFDLLDATLCVSEKLKQPGKLVFYLFTIMFLIVRDSHELGPCYQNCFGPVTKLKIFNQASGGFLHVKGRTVVAAIEGDGIIYRISAGRNFYLYDMKAEKFICWKKLHKTKGQRNNRTQKFSTSLIARKFSNYNCQFMDKIGKDTRSGYVNLVPAFNSSLKMKFNNKGRDSQFQNCTASTQRTRHAHKWCFVQASFLIQRYIDDRYDDDRACKCPEARRHFCQRKFAKMKVFEDICSLSNETYDF
ncbi:unnamed protein product [Psylliodes chrysocephalus]|uniref:Uncharacterized protein n=1 Tax=Psylliodes chrysocephalus TaxID=3402493 RepID=A0A9P0D6W9_9CUCU|nr:unnamed protein product [Psylliodes chrysocephala]